MLPEQIGATDPMDTVEHMRDIVLAAAYLAYRRTGSYSEAARLLGLPASRSDLHGWLVRCVVPSDELVYETYCGARELLQAEIDTVQHRMGKFMQPAEAISVVRCDSETLG